jgi:modulator of FtsH protease
MFPAPQEPTYRAAFGAGTDALERVAFLRRVYLLMTGAVAVSGVTAAVACLAGPSATVVVNRVPTAIPPLVYWFVAHPIIAFVMLLGATFGASAVSRKPGINVVALFGFAAVVGLFVAPAIYFAQLRAAAGDTLSPQPVLHSFALAAGAFVGLSAYALITKRDFSFMRGFLTMGLFVVIGASVLNIFFGGAVLSLAIASTVVLLFCGFILYDTSRLLRDGETEAVPAALSLFLNFFNLFLALLRIFGGGRRDS